MMQILKKIIVSILTTEARLIIAKYRPYIIAVTGSVGKTSTKDAIYSVLKDHIRYVRKSEKSQNSEIGLPLTIIGAPNAWHSPTEWLRNIWKGLMLILKRSKYPDCLILEVGADHPGDIKNLVKWLRPDIAVITHVGSLPVHVEYFKSPEEVFEEKASLVRAVKKDGKAVIFADDEKMVSLAKELEMAGISVLTYGLSEVARVRGIDYEFVQGSLSDQDSWSNRFNVKYNDEMISVNYKNPVGRTGMFPLLAAVAIAIARGLTVSDISKSLGSCDAPRGRMNILRGINGSVLIDDSYNSSPDAVRSALGTLREIRCEGRKIAILGDMMELGKYSVEEHKKIGREISSSANFLITVGQRSRATAEEALRNGIAAESVRSFDSSPEAASFAHSMVRSGDVVLVKGSQAARMERVVAELLADSSKANELLVRQEPEWIKRG